jgi:PAS domain S-box-containing protein
MNEKIDNTEIIGERAMSGDFSFEDFTRLIRDLERENRRLRKALEKSYKEPPDDSHVSPQTAKSQSKSYIFSILNNIPDPICVKDDKSRWVLVNNKFCEIIGAERKTLLGKTDFDYFPKPEAEFNRKQDEEVLQNGKDSVSEQTFVNATTGKTILLNIKKTLYVSEEGDRFVVAIGRDITDIKRMQGQIQHSQKMESLGTLAGGIAHDFNNILYPILGMAELLLDDLPEESPAYDNVKEILKAGRRGSDLVKQILTFSRQSEHAVIPIQPQQVLKDTVKFSRATIPTSIDITEKIQKDCGLILADPTQLHQVALNIITNAFQAMEGTGGEITVQLEERKLERSDMSGLSLEEGRYAILTIADNGPGIDPQVIERIFEPYFTTKIPGKGSGIGLAVVYRILKDHKGDIRVYSEPGKGARFEVYLPVLDKSHDSGLDEPQDVEVGGAERILLIDDEEPIIKLEKDLLERFGYQVAEMTESVAALDLFEEHPDGFDLVITDMTMPGMTGDQLAIRMLSTRPDIPIVLCTGYSERISKEQAYQLGIKGFLAKPFSKNELGKMVRDVLDGTSAPE